MNSGFRTYSRGVEKGVQGFISVDPLTSSYPMLTPYQFASNTPIQAIDLDGLEADITIDKPATYKPRVGQVVRSGELSRYRVTPSGNVRKPSVWRSPNGLRTVSKVGRWLGGRAMGTVGLLLEPVPAGQPTPPHILNIENTNVTVATSHIERFTDDPSNLDEDYLRGVRERLADGSASEQDKQYEDEANRRVGALGRGMYNALKHGGEWAQGSMKDAIDKFTPGAKGRPKGAKVIFTNEENGLEITYDRGGKYFRIQDTTSGQYLRPDGKQPKVGHLRKEEAKDQRQRETHILNTDDL